MAILDNEHIMSNAQAFTASGATISTNKVDFGRAGAGYNKKILVSVAQTVTSDGNATVLVAIRTDDNAAMSSATTLFSTAAIAKATLVAGYLVAEFTLPAEVERYVDVSYTVGTADLTAGKFNAWCDTARQTNMTII